MKHQHRLDWRIRQYARIELHACGEIENPNQIEQLMLLRARVSALLAAEYRKLNSPKGEPATTKQLDLLPTTTEARTDGVQANETADEDDIPF